MFLRGRVLPVLAIALVLLPAAATAESPSAEEAAPVTLPEVEVVGATPLLGSGVDRDKVPAQTHVLTDRDISRDGYPQVLRALNEDVPGVTLDAAAGNPFQPNLLYHGFLASPLQGNPQGLAVYLNGARFNQPFGDTVNWDLIPDLAVDRMDLVGSNPVFGLNALGGALSIRMKNGFTYQGGEIDLLGGSFAHYQGNLQYGVQSGSVAAYIAATGLHEGAICNPPISVTFTAILVGGAIAVRSISISPLHRRGSTARGPLRSSCWQSIPAHSSPPQI